MDKIGKGVLYLVLAGCLIFGYIGFQNNCESGKLKNEILEQAQEIKANKIVMAKSAKKIRDQAKELKKRVEVIVAVDPDIKKLGELAVVANEKAKKSSLEVGRLINELKGSEKLKTKWKKDLDIQTDKYNKLKFERDGLFKQNKQWKLWAADVFIFMDDVLDYIKLSEKIVVDFEDQLKLMLKLHNKRFLIGLTIGPGVHAEGFEYLMMNLGATLRIGKKFELPASYKELSKLSRLRKKIEGNKIGG